MLARCRETRAGRGGLAATSSSASAARPEESFQKTCDLVREARFKNSFIFKYSPRPGTKADDLYADDVPEEVKKRRNNDLLAIQNARRAWRTIAAQVGRDGRGAGRRAEQDGAASDGSRRAGPMQLTGRTRSDHIVVFDGNPRLAGRTVDVDIREATAFTLFGDVVTGETVGAEEARVPPAGRFGLPMLQ